MKRATKKRVALSFVEVIPDLPGISIAVHRINASLARKVAAAFLGSRAPRLSLSSDDIQAGIQGFSWPGRFQTIGRGKILWCLDGAHNPMSAAEAARWFDEISDPEKCAILHSNSYQQLNRRRSMPTERFIVFALNSDRHDAFGTLKSLREGLKNDVSCVLFTSDTDIIDATRIAEFERIWRDKFPDTRVVTGDLEDVMEQVREAGNRIELQVLVTGSLYLVGSVLKVLS